MHTIDPATFDKVRFSRLLTGAVAPRPIAFVSSINQTGQINLSPYSFFNVFSYRPPILIFSVSRRMRDNTVKDTLENVLEIPEVVINIVNYSLVEQMSLTSTEYESGINEFEKAGLSSVASQRVKPPRVKESPVAFECRVNQVVPLGETGGAGNLVICEVVLAHFAEKLFDEHQSIDPVRLDAVARLGGNWYARADEAALFEITKPGRNLGIGVDQLPESIRNSTILSGNDLGRLGNLEAFPHAEALQALRKEEAVQILMAGRAAREQWHEMAKEVLKSGNPRKALGVLMLSLEVDSPTS